MFPQQDRINHGVKVNHTTREKFICNRLLVARYIDHVLLLLASSVAHRPMLLENITGSAWQKKVLLVNIPKRAPRTGRSSSAGCTTHATTMKIVVAREYNPRYYYRSTKPTGTGANLLGGL